MLEERIIEELKRRRWKVSTAESCTGGMIAAALIGAAGASVVFDEGYITYSNSSKEKLLGVEADQLRQFGAVSRIVAKQMAEGAARQASAQVSVAATGIAGPDGGTAEKPVGLVYIGCHVNGKTTVMENRFQGNRWQVREQTTKKALELLFECLTGE